MRCKASQFAEIDKQDMLAYRKFDYQVDALVADRRAAERKYRDIVIDNATIEEIMLMLVKGEKL